jgi:WD40 repeat protein
MTPIDLSLLASIIATRGLNPALSMITQWERQLPDDERFSLLTDCLPGLARLLARCKNTEEVAQVLLQRLRFMPEFDADLDLVSSKLRPVYFDLWHRLPDQADDELPKVHRDQISSCLISPDGRFAITVGGDGLLVEWDTETGAVTRQIHAHQRMIWGCAIRADGRQVATSSGDQTIKLWDHGSGEAQHTLIGHEDDVNQCAYSPVGGWLVSASNDHTLRLWDTITGTWQRTLTGHRGAVLGCAVSPDGSRIVSCSDDQTMIIWDAATGEPVYNIHQQTHQDAIMHCAISPDGQRLASVSLDFTARLWDFASGQPLHELRGHQELALGCAFSPNGRWLLTASFDRTLKLWDVVSGENRATFYGISPMFTCAWHPDSTHLIAGSDQIVYWLKIVES